MRKEEEKNQGPQKGRDREERSRRTLRRTPEKRSGRNANLFKDVEQESRNRRKKE